MGEFSPDWLSLREPPDHQARSEALTARLVRWLDNGPAANPIEVLDLGAGCGSNLRYLAPSLGGRQCWICVDRDPGLLAVLLARTGAWALAQGFATHPGTQDLVIEGPELQWQVETLRLDLAAGPSALPLGHGTLLSASALLDLVSESWLAGLLQACGRNRAPLLAALNYDGRVRLRPPEPLDGLVIGLVNGHQRRDKGLGPALGPSAPRVLGHLARALGYQVISAASDWRLGPVQVRVQEALIDGWAQAAREQTEETSGLGIAGKASRESVIEDWRQARLGYLSSGRSELHVGHQDLLLLPPAKATMTRWSLSMTGSRDHPTERSG